MVISTPNEVHFYFYIIRRPLQPACNTDCSCHIPNVYSASQIFTEKMSRLIKWQVTSHKMWVWLDFAKSTEFELCKWNMCSATEQSICPETFMCATVRSDLIKNYEKLTCCVCNLCVPFRICAVGAFAFFFSEIITRKKNNKSVKRIL